MYKKYHIVYSVYNIYNYQIDVNFKYYNKINFLINKNNFSLNKLNLKFISRSHLVKKNYNKFFLSYFFLINYFENFLHSKIIVVNRSSLFTNPHYDYYLKIIYILVRRLYRRVSRKFNLYNFINIFFSSLYCKDLILFKNFLSRRLSSISFRNHKRFLLMFRLMARLLFNFLIRDEKILGFFFSLSGKIGLAGSVKTRTWRTSNGMTNLSSKKTKLKFEKFQIWTRSGVLGCKIGLIY